MENECKYNILKNKREELGNYIKEARKNYLPSNIGLNKFAEISGISSSLISKIENGKILKISPFLLQDIADSLDIDYKELYKIVGYLDKNEKIIEKFKKINRKKSEIIIWNGNKHEVIDISYLSKEKIKDLKKYVDFLKIDFNYYNEFIKWKKEKDKKNKIEKFFNDNIPDSIKKECKIKYTESTINSLFEENKMRLNKKGKEFYRKLSIFFGGEKFFDELINDEGDILSGSKKEYQMLKIVKYYAINVPLNFE